MTYIGQHDNIVNLIGAYTDDIRERKLDLVVELCMYGNLLTYLQTRRGLFVNQVEVGSGEFKDDNMMSMLSQISSFSVDQVTTEDLVRWALQTAKGIEYLHGKKIIHGDLAARNVLLTIHRVAKISDFGLSRKIYRYQKNYVRDSTVKMLPWRWLAPEQFTTHLLFSQYTDIWSYGVTLFEFFSLGETPYSHFLDFHRDFVSQIKSGALQMDRPSYCPSSVYQIMKGCWELDPQKRLEPLQIISTLEKVMEAFERPPGENRNEHLVNQLSLEGESQVEASCSGGLAPLPYVSIFPTNNYCDLDNIPNDNPSYSADIYQVPNRWQGQNEDSHSVPNYLPPYVSIHV